MDANNPSVGVEFSDVLDKLEMAGRAHVEVQGDDRGAFAAYLTRPHRFIAGYRHMEIALKGGGDTVHQTVTSPVVAHRSSF